MKIISKANQTILRILKPFLRTEASARWLHYCIKTPVEDGILVFNLMTREMVLLSDDEYSDFLSNPYLKVNWFTVPTAIDEKEFIDIIRTFIQRQQKNLETITNYSVFTTTDCNARCFYCYEAGCTKVPMREEVCNKIITYIKNHCGGNPVRINWFGGEPLLNTEAIDTICNGLIKEGIQFRSKMITNGYLLNETNIKKAKGLWNLQEIQITLDGTEEVYNKVKDYVYAEGNPYEIVLSNIQNLLDAKQPVSIRLNLDIYNIEDLLALSDELGKRFKGQKLYVYVHKLFQENKDYTDEAAAQECAALEAGIQQVETKLRQHGLKPNQRIPKQYKTFYCMADCGNAITFLPNGEIGLCEVHTENEFIGHIDKEGFDQAVIDSWKELRPEIPACAKCFYYPECYVINKCASATVCYPAYQEAKLRQMKESMVYEYQISNLGL